MNVEKMRKRSPTDTGDPSLRKGTKTTILGVTEWKGTGSF